MIKAFLTSSVIALSLVPSSAQAFWWETNEVVILSGDYFCDNYRPGMNEKAFSKRTLAYVKRKLGETKAVNLFMKMDSVDEFTRRLVKYTKKHCPRHFR